MRLSLRHRLLGTAFLALSLLHTVCGRANAQVQPSADLTTVPAPLAASARPLPFVAAPAFHVTDIPSSVLARDLNGDGKVDLVVASATAGQISVYMGLGEGRFLEPQVYRVGGHPVSVLCADLSGDGRQEIVTANGSDGTVSVFAGAGDGRFSAPKIYSTGVSADLLAFGDLSGAGKQDLVIASLSGKTFSVLLNDGHGALENAMIHSLNSTPTALAVADFNSDKRADVAFANADGTVSLLSGEGNGTFGPSKSFSVSSSRLSLVVAGDFNRDGKMDLAVAQTDGHAVSIFTGQGDGTFVRGTSYQTGNGPVSAMTVDLRGDGLVDLVTVNRESNNFSVLMGNGDGTFKLASNFTAGDGPVAAAAGDFLGSGFTGLAIVNASAKSVSVIAGNGDGSFKAAPAYTSDLSPRFIASGDLNGDGRPDLVVSNFCGSDIACLRSSTLTTFLAKSSGGYQPPMSREVGRGLGAVALVDLDGDKVLDAIVLDRTDRTVSVLLGAGNGTFRDPIVTSLADVPVALAVGDFDGDGKTDLAIATDCAASPCGLRGTLKILLGSGDGRFKRGQDFAVGFSPTSIAVGALKTDGSLDIVVANRCGVDASCKSTGSATVLAGSGNGSFTVAVDLALGSNLSSVALADLRGMGVLDLVVSEEGDDSVAVLRGNGDGSFQSPATYTVGSSPRSAVVADFDGDGHPDIAVSNFGDSTVGVLFGKGDGTFTAASKYAVGAGPESLTAVDNEKRPAGLVTANGNSAGATLGTDITQLASVHPEVSAAASMDLTGPSTSPNVNESTTFTVVVTSVSVAPSGTVAFTINGGAAACTQTNVVSGNTLTSKCVTSLVSAPSVVVKATYSGDPNNSAGPVTLTQPVTPLAATLAVTGPSTAPTVNEAATFTATLSGVAFTPTQPTGTLTFSINGAADPACPATTLSAGAVTATCTTNLLTATSSTVKVTYTGDASFTADPTTITQPVNLLTPTLTLTPTSGSSKVNQSSTFMATLSGVAFTPTRPDGVLTFTVNGNAADCSTTTLTGGTLSATCNTSLLTAASSTVKVTYTNDANFTAGPTTITQPVAKGSSVVKVTAGTNTTGTSELDVPITLVATVTAGQSGTYSPSGGKVSFQTVVGNGAATNIPACSGANALLVPANGIVTCSTGALAFGNNSITASYTGDDNFNASAPSGAFNQNVIKGTPVVTPTTVSAQVNAEPSFIVTVAAMTGAGYGTVQPLGGKVTFSVTSGSTTYNLCTTGALTASGTLSCTATSAPLPESSTAYTVTATYDGTGDTNNFGNGSGTTQLQVSKATPVVSVTGPAVASSVINQPVLFSATVTANSIPTGGFPPSGGNVSFSANGGTTALCTAVLAATNSCSINSLPVSTTNTVSAMYAGDSNFNSASGSQANVVVTHGPTQTALTSSSTNNQSTVNESVTFYAAVSQTPIVGVTLGQAFTPLGKVTFSTIDGTKTTTLCTDVPSPAPSGGTATCTVAAGLALGTNSITAVFTPSDNNFITSTGTATQTVIAAGTTVTAPLSSKPSSVVNDSVVFTATVTGNPAGKTAPTLGSVLFTLIPTGSITVAASCPGAYTSTDPVTNISTFSCAALNALDAGSYSVKAEYVPGPGDAFTSGTSASATQMVGKATATLAVSSSAPMASIAGQPVTFTATVTPATAAVKLGGTVAFTVSGGDGSVPAGCDGLAISSATNLATCTITFATNKSAPFTVLANYSDPNYTGSGIDPQSVEDFALVSVTNNMLPGAPVAAKEVPAIVYLTPGYTVGGNANADPFFGAVSVNATSYSGYSRTVTYACVPPSAAPAGLSCLNPAGTSAQGPVSFSIAATATTGPNDYSYSIAGTDSGTPALGVPLTRSAALTLRVIPLNLPIAINQTTRTATQVSFQLPSASSETFTFQCLMISSNGALATSLPKDFACTPPQPSSITAGSTVSFTVGNSGTSASLSPAIRPTSGIFNATVFGLPSFGLLLLLARRNVRGQKVYRLIALAGFAAGLSQMIGCSAGGFSPPTTTGVSAPIPVGNYQILVSATGTASDVYYSVIQMDVVAQ